MGALHRSPRIRFRSSRKDGAVSVLALTGATASELRAADGWARANGGRVLRIAVDGGLLAWREIRRRCDLYVGDGDSAAPPRDTESILYETDKAFSDLAGALDVAHRRGARVGCVAGLTGGRLDHEWGNLLELAAHVRKFRGLLAPTPRGWVVLTAGGVTVETLPGRTFSLFAPAGPARVDLSGSRWTLRDARLRPGSRGLSNVTGERLRLTVRSGAACLVFPEP